MQTNVAPSLLVLLVLLLRRHRHRHRHLLFLAAACSDLTRRDLDVDRVRFISPPHAKACKRARERARLTGDRYLGSVVARGSLPRRFRICGASSHARVVRAIAYRLWKTRRVQFDTFGPRWCRYDSAGYNAGQLPIPCTFGGKNGADRKHVGVGDAFDHLVHNICTGELNGLNGLSDKSSPDTQKGVSR